MSELTKSTDQLKMHIEETTEPLRSRCSALEEQMHRGEGRYGVVEAQAPIPRNTITEQETEQAVGKVPALVLTQATHESAIAGLRDKVRELERAASRAGDTAATTEGRLDKLRADLCSVAQCLNSIYRQEREVRDDHSFTRLTAADAPEKISGVWHGLPPETALRAVFRAPAAGEERGKAVVSVGSNVESFDWDVIENPCRLRLRKGPESAAVLEVAYIRQPDRCRHVSRGYFEEAVLFLRGSLPGVHGKEHHLARLTPIDARDAETTHENK
jgi:hypothetical protein